MPDHPLEDRGSIIVEDPTKVTWIDEMQQQADADTEQWLHGSQGRQRSGARKIYFWADPELQRLLESVNSRSPGSAAKHIVQEFFAGRRGRGKS